MSDTNVMFKGPGSGYPMTIFSANEIRTFFEMIPITVSFVCYESVYFSRTKCTLQKKEVCAQLFDLEKHFKICYVYGKRKPK